MSKLTDLRGQLDAARKELNEAFEQAGTDFDMDSVKVIEGDSAAKAEWFRKKNDEITDYAKQLEELDSFQGMKETNEKRGELMPHPGHALPGKKHEQNGERKSVGELFTDSAAFTNKGASALIDINVKSLFTTAGGSIAYTDATTGWYPMDFRSPRFVDYFAANQPLRVADLIPSTTTTAAAITYIQEDSFTNAAVEVAEGSAKPEAALSTTTVTEPVRKIAVWIPVTDEQLADVPQVEGYINNRLGFMVRQRLDTQILKGDGTAPNISGIQDRSGIQTQAKGGDSTPDAVYKAITKIRVNDFAEPNGVVMHPNDWQQIRLLTTADGIYIWGPPMDAGPERIWGLTVVQTVAETEGTGLVGDFNQAELAMRQGLEVRVTDSHASLFISNIQVILVELRAALLVFRPASFCTVTGI